MAADRKLRRVRQRVRPDSCCCREPSLTVLTVKAETHLVAGLTCDVVQERAKAHGVHRWMSGAMATRAIATACVAVVLQATRSARRSETDSTPSGHGARTGTVGVGRAVDAGATHRMHASAALASPAPSAAGDCVQAEHQVAPVAAVTGAAQRSSEVGAPTMVSSTGTATAPPVPRVPSGDTEAASNAGSVDVSGGSREGADAQPRLPQQGDRSLNPLTQGGGGSEAHSSPDGVTQAPTTAAPAPAPAAPSTTAAVAADVARDTASSGPASSSGSQLAVVTAAEGGVVVPAHAPTRADTGVGAIGASTGVFSDAASTRESGTRSTNSAVDDGGAPSSSPDTVARLHSTVTRVRRVHADACAGVNPLVAKQCAL